MILSVSVRLHPRPETSATAIGASADPAALGAAARSLAAAPLELDSLDVEWSAANGSVLARCSGADPARRARRAAALLRAAGLEQIDLITDDRALWARQRGAQRSAARALVRVAARPSALEQVIRAAQDCDATLVGRAALGTSYLELDPEAVVRLRDSLPAGAPAVLLDCAPPLWPAVDAWGPVDEGAVELMRRLKGRFDPAGICNPGGFIAGI
jgi:glycolate oxidase FAD binding subunit